MFRKRTSILERSFEVAGIDLSAPLGKYLLNKMLEYGYGDKKVVIERVGESRFQILEPIHHNEGDFFDWVAEVELIHGTNDWYVMVLENIDSSTRTYEWRDEVVYSESDLFGKRVVDV